jgi:hypothetical protein
VLRHLRPEFRAQLSLGPVTKRLHERSAETNVEEAKAVMPKR